ncbi:MAG: ribonuclease J [Clostridia bacterium]|nr:ribonuclease J [Clostridia bacterium]
MGEVGKNMMALEYAGKILVIDCGLTFPDKDAPGIDVVIPDMTYLKENAGRVVGLFITHGHEDHVGALPYFLRDFQVPVFATRFTTAIANEKLKEHGLRLPSGSRVVHPGETIPLGPFKLRPFRVNHSIPDSVGVAVQTDPGWVVFTGDFKIDYTPVDGQPADLDRLAQFGREGVLCLCGDSTNAERPGVTPSERDVGPGLADAVALAEGRVFVATFASNVHRVQQVIEAAQRAKRKVAFSGRSLEQTVALAVEEGFLSPPHGVVVPLDEAAKLPPEKVVVITTGSQGEALSALARMARGDHRQIQVQKGDTVVISATPIPGNEKDVQRTIDNLYRLGAKVIYGPEARVHVSGHGSRDEMKLVIRLVRPRHFVPVHGEYRMLVHHAELARACGVPEERIHVIENGQALELTWDRGRVAGTFPAGGVFVDGLGVGDVGNIVLRDRRQLSEDGILIVVVGLEKRTSQVVAGPDIISRGFVYVRESEKLLEEARQRVMQALTGRNGTPVTEWSTIKSLVRDALAHFLFEKTKRRPMILPIVLEI